MKKTINGHPYDVEKGLLCSYSSSVNKVLTTEGKWCCNGSVSRPYKCLSMILNVDGVYPDIVSYRCVCSWNHRICEACYIFYQE